MNAPVTIADLEAAAELLTDGKKVRVRVTLQFDWTDGSSCDLMIPGIETGAMWSVTDAKLAACDAEIVP